MSKILIPFDFSSEADFAIDLGKQIAMTKLKAEVVLFHIIPHPSEQFISFMGGSREYDPMENIYFSKLIKGTTEKIVEKANDLRDYGFEVKYKIRVGNPFKTLSEEILSRDPDLVISASAGPDSLADHLFGTNTEKILQKVSCPVLTIREKTSLENIKTVVFASDFHNLSEDFTRKLKDFLQPLRATLRFVKINTPENFTTTRQDLSLINAFIKSSGLKEAQADVYNFTNESGGICSYAEDVQADLLMIGTRQRSTFSRFLDHSVSLYVVENTTCPVWTLGF